MQNSNFVPQFLSPLVSAVQGFDWIMLSLLGLFAFVIAVFIFASYAHKVSVRRAYANWLTWPTMDEYVVQYPETRTSRGVVCYNCRSGNIRNFSFGDLVVRAVACRACDKTLYRIAN